MSEIKHHLSDDILMAYASGNLPEAFSVAVAAHVSMCDTCRATLESFDAIGGSLLTETAPVETGADAFQSVMDKIRQAPSEAPVLLNATPDFPTPLSDYVGESLDEIKWQPIGMGVKQSILHTQDDATARLLYIPPGTAVPNHSHEGLEMTLVLQGAFADETEYFSVGDIELADGSTVHTPIAADGQPCICLAVTEAPLKFKKMFHRLVQPLMRI
ncbi:MAG: ChrR family anti-sigma-E factor [Paracoccaceae bacterium]